MIAGSEETVPKVPFSLFFSHRNLVKKAPAVHKQTRALLARTLKGTIMSMIPYEVLHPNDKYVIRDRVTRWLVLLAYLILTPLILTTIGQIVFLIWFGENNVGWWIGTFAGLFGTAYLFSITLENFFVSVDLVSAFVTTDRLYTLIKGKSAEKPDPDSYIEESDEEKTEDRKAFPTYGPGLHVAFPWEDRDEENNFSLKETPTDISFPVLVKDGELNLEGSHRLRPDLRRLIPFLSGIGSIPSEMKDLIVAFAVEFLSEKTVDEALKSLPELNTELNKKFGLRSDKSDPAGPSDRVSDFEKRFGLYVGDVTISKILPSEDLRRTRGGLEEARVISEGTAVVMNYENVASMMAARKAGDITDEQISRARDRFLSISGNLDGMEINKWEGSLHIEGLDPETVKQLGKLAPLANKFAGGKSKPKPKGNRNVRRRKSSGQKPENSTD